MNRLKSVLLVILAFVALVATLYGLWRVFAAVLTWVTSQESQVAAAVIAFSGTVIAGIATVVIAQQRSKSREIAEAHRHKKIELYNSFITTIIALL